MMKRVTVKDNFLPTELFKTFNSWARLQDYAGVRNPVDGVWYPDIVVNIPEEIVQEVRSGIAGNVWIHHIVLRLTTLNTSSIPHQAHNDAVMSEYTFVLYMQDGEGGTSLVRHKETGMDAHIKDDEALAIWARDTNIPDAWEIHHMMPMKANRAVWYPSEYMHRAEPVGGFGQDASDGRIGLIAWLSINP